MTLSITKTARAARAVEREKRRLRVSQQKIEKGDTVAYEVRFARGQEPKRKLGEVIDVGHAGVRVNFENGTQLWLKNGQVDLVASREMKRAERLRNQRAAERAEESKVKKPAPMSSATPAANDVHGPDSFGGEDYPTTPAAPDLGPPPVPRAEVPAPPPPASVVVASSIDALVAAGQDPFALFLAMGAALAGHQRAEAEKARAAHLAACAEVESARELLADAERRRETARVALEVAEAKLAQVQVHVGAPAPVRAA